MVQTLRGGGTQKHAFPFLCIATCRRQSCYLLLLFYIPFTRFGLFLHR